MKIERSPTSVVLQDLLRRVPEDQVTLAWVIDQLSERSFGIVLLLVALVALIPGLSPIAALLLALVAAQMILAKPEPRFPRFLSGRRLSKTGLSKIISRITPPLQRLERVIRPRWITPFEATKRLLGVVTFLLSITLVAPIPFSQFIPSFVIMLLALAFLEEDGVLLVLSLAAALFSLALTAATIWGAIEAGLAV